MESECKSAVDEVRYLQGCANDLIGIQALAAVWSGRESAEVLGALLEVIVGALRLDLAYAWIGASLEGPPLEAVRLAQRESPGENTRQLGHAFAERLRSEAPNRSLSVANPIGEGQMWIVSVRLGLREEIGVVAAGARRADFPTPTELLLLRLVVDLAAIGLQEARHRAAQSRVADEFERRVAERTEQLTAVNAELVKETARRKRTEEALKKAVKEIAVLKDKLAQEKVYVKDEIRTASGFQDIVGESAALTAVLKQVERVASTDSTVLVLGETGSGKERIARAIHDRSARRDKSFVTVNCAAIPLGLVESELFGHEKGAFSGAIARKIGRFELADQGTLFLDEVGDIPLELQPKLFRVLQEQEFERLGSTRTQRVNVRVVAATNRDLARMIADREFRSDLYFRLNVFPIRIPPLRARPEDIRLLVLHFTDLYSRRMGKRIDAIAAEVMDALMRYSWPGNVRELANFIERAVILSPGRVLQPPLAELTVPFDAPFAPPQTLEDAERTHILRALEDSRWVVGGPAGAAVRLGLKRTTLLYKMARLGIPHRRP